MGKVWTKYGNFEHLTDLMQYRPGSRNVGSAVYHFLVLDSTNTFAAKLLTNTRPKHGTLVLADTQTAGKGQFGNSWHAAPGLNLTLSLILYPQLPASRQFLISMAISLALHDLVREVILSLKHPAASDSRPDPPKGESRSTLLKPDLRIKWPNDLYVHDKKIGGILIQNTIQGENISSCIAGVGLNVNETNFPPSLPNPTSLLIEKRSSVPLDICALNDALITCIDHRLTQLTVDASETINQYHLRLYRRDTPSRFLIKAENTIRSGMILGVDDYGRLMINWENGDTSAYQNREIEYVLKQ